VLAAAGAASGAAAAYAGAAAPSVPTGLGISADAAGLASAAAARISACASASIRCGGIGPWSAISGARIGAAAPAETTVVALPVAMPSFAVDGEPSAIAVTDVLAAPVPLSTSVEPPPQAASMAVVAAAIVARSGRKGTEMRWWRVMRVR